MEERKQRKRQTPKSLYINLSKEAKKYEEAYIYVYRKVRRGRRYITLKLKQIIPKVTSKRLRTHNKAYIRQFTRNDTLQKQRQHKRMVERVERMKKEREQLMRQNRKDVNARIVGIGQVSQYAHQSKHGEICIESSLPQYNLGGLFGLTQEKLYPKQRQSRHSKGVQVNETIEKEINRGMVNKDEYEMVKESSLHVKKVYYTMIEKGKEIGITRECALVSLFYGNGIYPVQNIGRRAARFEKEMNSNPQFLQQMKDEYEQENNRVRRRRLALEQYHAIQSNIESLEYAIEHAKSLEPRRLYAMGKKGKTPLEYVIKTVPVDGQIDRKYKNIKEGVYGNTTKAKQEIEYLKEQLSTLIRDRKEELKEELKKYLTMTYIMKKDMKDEDLCHWKTIVQRKCEMTSNDLLDIAKEYGMEKDLTVSNKFIDKLFPDICIDSILPSTDRNSRIDRDNELVVKKIIFDDIDSLICFENVKQFIGVRDVEKEPKQTRTTSSRNNSSFDTLEMIIRSLNGISTYTYKEIRGQVVSILQRVYFNEDIVEIGTAYVKESDVVDALVRQVEWKDIIDHFKNGTIEMVIDSIREPIHILALSKLLDEATTVHREDEGNSQEELPDDIIEY